MSDLKGAKDIPIGGTIVDAGNSAAYKTGSWASQQPKYDHDKCTGCMICVNYCPDDCMTVGEDGKVASVNLDMCKGCGVCAAVCPVNSYTMETVN